MLMTHVVAGYPSEQECIDLMLGMQKAGVGIIEVQIPFSDPIADGETIMRANDKALENGMTTQSCFELIDKAKKSGLKIDVYIMSYFQKIFAFGLGRFCREARKVGVVGLIVPDLPYDVPEYAELNLEMEANGLNMVPVASPSMSDTRLNKQIENADGLIYLTSTKGITGRELNTSEELVKTARNIKNKKADLRLAIGFGIEKRKDVEEILKIADLAVVGSAVIRAINSGGNKAAIKLVNQLVSAQK